MQSNLSLDDYIRRARDNFVYLQHYAPDFPAEDRTSCAAEFGAQRAFVKEILRQSKTKNRQSWLQVVLRELDEAFLVYENGDLDKGLRLLDDAQRHYESAIADESFEATTFITDQKGETRRVEKDEGDLAH
jgi:hypothetical protein